MAGDSDLQSGEQGVKRSFFQYTEKPPAAPDSRKQRDLKMSANILRPSLRPATTTPHYPPITGTSLLILPPEIHLQIASYLNSPFWEIWPLRQTCRHFRNLVPPLGVIDELFQRALEEYEEEEGCPESLCAWLAESPFFMLCNLSILEHGGEGADYAELVSGGKRTVLWGCERCGALSRNDVEDEEVECCKCVRKGEERMRLVAISGT